MNLQGRDLTGGMTGDDVQLLQSELQTLDFAIPAGEIDGQVYGPATVKAVIEFQQRQGLALTGVVDETTALAINSAVDARRRQFVVRGNVYLPDGTHLARTIVRAFCRFRPKWTGNPI